MRGKDHTGSRYGRLTVVKRVASNPGSPRWLCLCDCGTEKEVYMNALKVGATRSCGCLNREIRRAAKSNLRHGMSKTREWRTWANIKARCSNPKHTSYKYYKKKGIKVCDRWMIFENFMEDMGSRPLGRYSIDRIDNKGNYSPENCRWADAIQQANNKNNNRLITHNDRTQSVSSWAKETGLKPYVIQSRIDRLKWSISRALTQPIRRVTHRK